MKANLYRGVIPKAWVLPKLKGYDDVTPENVKFDFAYKEIEKQTLPVWDYIVIGKTGFIVNGDGDYIEAYVFLDEEMPDEVGLAVSFEVTRSGEAAESEVWGKVDLSYGDYFVDGVSGWVKDDTVVFERVFEVDSVII